MASYSIPEEVIGVPLFVPDAHDYFSIGTAEMPNGDDCLVIHGDVSGDYKAFQPAPTLSPDLFKVRAVFPWSMSFWIKAAATVALNDRGANILMCPMNALVDGAGGFGMESSGYAWAFYGDTTNRIEWIGASSSGSGPASGVVRDDAWHLVVINKTSTSGGNMYVDLDTVGDGFSFNGTVTGSNLYFCIGSYSDVAGMGGYPYEWRLGKLAFHDHALSQTERALLYDTMMGV